MSEPLTEEYVTK